MAKNAKTNTVNANAKRSAGTPQGASAAIPTAPQQGTAKAVAAAPQAPLFMCGTMPPVRPGTHRAYAQATMRTLGKAHRKGFTLAALRKALVAGSAASNIAPPNCGWQAHNMPTWAAHNNQKWLVPAS